MVLALLFGQSRLLACSCARIAPACEAAWKAEAVFVGRPESIWPLTIFGIPLAWPWPPAKRRVRFLVSERFAGADKDTIELTTGWGGGDCGIDFQRGRSYLVYAYRDSTTRELLHGNLHPNIVSGRRRWRPGLFPESERQRAARTYVRICDRQFVGSKGTEATDPLPAVPIHATSNGSAWDTIADTAGSYDFLALPPGTYALSADMPRRLGGGESSVVPLHEHGCSEQILFAVEQASVGGTVVDNLSRPVSTTVHLAPAGPASPGRPGSQPTTLGFRRALWRYLLSPATPTTSKSRGLDG
jgi:hypothetical protein